jgi:hypothetical protein
MVYGVHIDFILLENVVFLAMINNSLILNINNVNLTINQAELRTKCEDLKRHTLQVHKKLIINLNLYKP